jgi:hypothetical protein
VLSRFVGASKYSNQGQRVVAGQQLMQASSDIFLGWQRTDGIDGTSRDFYVRQLRDWKYSIDIEDLGPRGMRMYGELCGWALARAHACSGDRIAIASYLGGSGVFDQAIAQFAAAYADQNESDHKSLIAAITSGRITAERGSCGRLKVRIDVWHRARTRQIRIRWRPCGQLKVVRAGGR